MTGPLPAFFVDARRRPGGATTKDGDDDDRLTTPYAYAETIYRKLGIDTERRLKAGEGRPVDFTDGGRPIVELF